MTTHLFQQWVDKAFDVRCTVVDDQAFAVAIHAASDAGHRDWRSDYAALHYEVVEPPEKVRVGMTNYLNRLGLSFGAFDFVVTPRQEWVFLECNPVGMWAWIEERTRAPIASAIADFLAGTS